MQGMACFICLTDLALKREEVAVWVGSFGSADVCPDKSARKPHNASNMLLWLFPFYFSSLPKESHNF